MEALIEQKSLINRSRNRWNGSITSETDVGGWKQASPDGEGRWLLTPVESPDGEGCGGNQKVSRKVEWVQARETGSGKREANCMDRSWMYSAPKCSVPFTNGVETFLDFAFEKSSVNGKILCPCTHCVNALYFGRQDVSDHLSGEAEEKLYLGCKYNKLSAIVHLYHIKCLNGYSNKSLDMMLEFLNDLLPEGNLLPKTTQQVKKIMSNLGLGYEKIHACPKGCVLFWEEKEKDESCSECGSSRWKESRDNLEIGNSPPKKKAAKILRWFPLKPRIQRLFMCSKTASLMAWHNEGRVNDGKIRHPADAQAWKDFDIKFPEFASEPRNVRLTLASDGFNPFRTMNVSNSIWPVVIIPYNLPPWLVMKQPNLILSLIIPGPSSPGNKIDVYMQPLIKELKELWDVGVETYDASNKQNFQLKAALMSTISDFPGYASLSGWSTKGALACPLPSDHRWRKDTRSFDGKEELRAAPKPSSGEEVLQELDGDFFRSICYKDLTEVDLQYLESKVSITLCKLEKIFPPSFFTVMVHLVIHLVREVKLGGPVTYRWMYFIERQLSTLKSYVRNRAHPEGSIAEGYLAQESLTFCSRYLSGVETIFTRPIRNDDEGDQNEIEERNMLCPGRPLGRKKTS
ncbi:hypothetical protein LXL04_015589 [Taraxacum kok-saghyz]